MEFVTLDPGEVLFNEWDRADFVCFVESGELDVTKKTGPDSSDVMATLETGPIHRRNVHYQQFSAVVDGHRPIQCQAGCFSTFGLRGYSGEEDGYRDQYSERVATLLSINLKKTSSRLADNMLPMG
jgi:CRP/FNR family cyclic AMP-dependent transcriptional regulator